MSLVLSLDIYSWAIVLDKLKSWPDGGAEWTLNGPPKYCNYHWGKINVPNLMVVHAVVFKTPQSQLHMPSSSIVVIAKGHCDSH